MHRVSLISLAIVMLLATVMIREIVVIQGDVAGGERSIELGESSGGGVDDWDVY